MQVPEFCKQSFETRITLYAKNGIVTSKIEMEILEYIKDNIDTSVIHQYYSKLYPYHCDYYLPLYDLYIELNGIWTHGPHPYDSNNQEDIIK